MSELHSDFDLCFDLKNTDDLLRHIETSCNPVSIMKMMFREIKARDHTITELKEEVVMMNIVSKAHQELVGELMVPEKETFGQSPPIKRDTFCGRDVRDEKDIDISLPPRAGRDKQIFAEDDEGNDHEVTDFEKVTDFIFNEEARASFCRHCGAGIPHRMGEGRCDKCIEHLPEDEKQRYHPNKIGYIPPVKDTTADADQALADVVAMDAEKGEPPEPEIMYTNRYECPCGSIWWDTWSSMCDDDCPTCGTTCSPTESTEDIQEFPTINYLNDPWAK